MLGHLPIEHIPHGVDTAIFHPLDGAACKRALGIPVEKWVLMFSAVDIRDRNKGGEELIAALRLLPVNLRRECLLLILGQGGEAMAQACDMAFYDAGYITDDRIKAQLFSAADLFVFPSRGEAFGLVLLESMACGTPVLTFDIDGVTDLVRDGKTGFRVPLDDHQGLSARIAELLKNTNMRHALGEECARVVQAEFTLTQQVKRYEELYRRLLEARPALDVREGVA
jgi:glycosyltransferase involved in cell wall biosynthesis